MICYAKVSNFTESFFLTKILTTEEFTTATKYLKLMPDNKTDYFINRYLNSSLTPEDQEQQIEQNLEYEWDQPLVGAWENCADYKVNSDGTCFYSFNTSAEAKKYCEEVELNEGTPFFNRVQTSVPKLTP